MSALQCLIENRADIDYMYGTMTGVWYNINTQLPIWIDWEVGITVVYTLKIILNMEGYVRLKSFGLWSLLLAQAKVFIDRRHKGNMTKKFACLNR